MSEVRFLHLERSRLDQALPALLEKALAEGRRVVVQASSDELVEALNERLWTYDDASFLPHGAAGDGDPARQPVFLTASPENPNGASLVVLLSGVDPPSQIDAGVDQVVLMFDGRDPEALAHARAQWTRLKGEGRAISYWREGDDGGWERAR